MTMSENMKTQVTLASDNEILITRTFAAPRKLVWEMWTKCEHLQHWWGPEGWSLPVCQMDFRPGGSWFYCMEGPDDMKSCGKTTYQEINAPESMVYKDEFTDGDGNPLEGMPVAHTSLNMTQTNNQTTVSSIVRYPTQADRDAVIEMGIEAGVDQTFNRLEAYLAKIS